MSWIRLIGTHLHLASNIVDLDDAIQAAAASGLGLPPGGTTGQTLLKDSGADGDASWHDIEDSATSVMDDSLVLKPDGVGGVVFAAASGVAGVTAVRTYISFGVNMSGQSYTP